ncbi:MAG: sigma-70 family RNA polymerase sigma factor [Alphaproteobacteria bacterium]|nr:sigma-70 family RNA polymerase sigma factor [Alphaproteobacteria bacterium]
MSDEAATIDAKVLDLIREGRADAATVLVLETHGPGIFRMMRGVFHDEGLVDDLYQRFSVELWRSLPRFQGRSSVYTWAYVLARRTITWRLRTPHHRKEQRLDTAQERGLLADHWTRTATPAWRRTEARSRFEELCETLPAEDRLLVMLRIGERMDWKQIVDVLDDDGARDAASRDKEAARLRKRFERVKLKLRDALGAP